jgi:ribosomal protein L37AE/L43A
MFFAGIISTIVLALVLTSVLVRRLIDPACPDCQDKSWSDVPRGITCRSCGWSSLPMKREQADRIAA